MQTLHSLFPEKQLEAADGSHGPDPAQGPCSSAPHTVGLVGTDCGRGGPLVLPHRYLLGLSHFPRGRWRRLDLYLMVLGPFEETLRIMPPSSPSQPRDKGRE